MSANILLTFFSAIHILVHTSTAGFSTEWILQSWQQLRNIQIAQFFILFFTVVQCSQFKQSFVQRALSNVQSSPADKSIDHQQLNKYICIHWYRPNNSIVGSSISICTEPDIHCKLSNFFCHICSKHEVGENQLHIVQITWSTTNSVSMMSAHSYLSCEINNVPFSIFLPLSISLSCSLSPMDIPCKLTLNCSVDSQYDDIKFSNSPQLYRVCRNNPQRTKLTTPSIP